MTTTQSTRYSDARLAEDATSTLPGIRRTAELLATVPEPARRALVQEARYTGNLVNMGRPSDALAAAIAEFNRSGAASFTSPLARAIYAG